LTEAHNQCHGLKELVDSLTVEKNALIQDYEDKLVRTTNRFTTEIEVKDQKLIEITADFHILQQQSRSNVDTSEILDDYKKRAQLALKKVIDLLY
jgi:hypothetical protein